MYIHTYTYMNVCILYMNIYIHIYTHTCIRATACAVAATVAAAALRAVQLPLRHDTCQLPRIFGGNCHRVRAWVAWLRYVGTGAHICRYICIYYVYRYI